MKEFYRYDAYKLKEMISRLGRQKNLEIKSRDICRNSICSQYDTLCDECMFCYENSRIGVDCNYSLGGFSSTPIRIILNRLKEVLGQADLAEYKKFKRRKE